jgi:dephospho-CoA kinase
MKVSRFVDTLANAGAPYACILGICGGIASGKSTALSFLSSRTSDANVICVSADALGHAAYAPGGPANARVAELFPSAVRAGGTIDRAALGAAIFGDAVAREALNAAVWPAVAELALAEFVTRATKIHQEEEEGVANARPLIGVLEAALLIEAGWAGQCDAVWLLSVPRDAAIARIVARGGGIDTIAASARFDAQPDVASRLATATAAGIRINAVFDTSGPIAETQTQMQVAWNDLLLNLTARGISSSSSSS